MKLKFPNLSTEFFATLFDNEFFFESAIKALLNAKESDFSEDDPLLLIVPNAGDINSHDYITSGNYGLQQQVAGSLPWPGIV